MKHNAQERGQALIIIALAAIGLFAFSALAIDGSMVFSDKRHAQNAADTAALAGALAHARGNDITPQCERADQTLTERSPTREAMTSLRQRSPAPRRTAMMTAQKAT